MRTLTLLLAALLAPAPLASAYFTMTQTQAQSCGGTNDDSDGAVDQASAASMSTSSGMCDDGSSSSAVADASADIAAGTVTVAGEGVGFSDFNGSFAQGSFGDRLFVDGVPTGIDTVTIRVTIDLNGIGPTPAFFNSASFDATVNAQVAPGQVELRACNGDLCFGGVQPLRDETLVEDVVLNRNGLGEFGFIDVFMDARFAIADASTFINGQVSVEVLSPAEASIISESGVFGQVVDSDDDGVSDTLDNCTERANPDQRDTDGDGFGNLCDADLNNDCVVNVVDLGILRDRFFTADDDADFDGDGAVNAVDLGIMRLQFFAPPGPAATNCEI